MYKLYVTPIGAGRTEVYEFDSEAVANAEFRQSCSPLLNVMAQLLYVGPNPLFPSKTMTLVTARWILSDGAIN